ncbi:MAG TPA: alanine racemase [Usitatibacter sp.]|nr:alanine racemase [Usitatibacter sp.]
MARPIRATISLEALRHNYAVAKRTAARSRVFAVVKANAYGHGLERVTRALGEADGFGIVELEGAIETRDRGYRGPIVLLEGFFNARELEPIEHENLTAVVHNDDQIGMLEAATLADPIDVFLKINTGMNRLGFPPEVARDRLARLERAESVKTIVLMTHFATADGPEGVAEAIRRFNAATEGIPKQRSLCNTAGIFAHPEAHADIVRLGIGLYGATPFADRSAESLGLKPAMTLTSELIAIQELKPGETVGYGGTFRADKPMKIGVVACGYADGYPRHAPSGTPVLVGGVRTKTAGRVSMDMIMVDVTGMANARVGTPVTLWGDGLPIDDVATAAGTVGYELMCALGTRVPVVEAR